MYRWRWLMAWFGAACIETGLGQETGVDVPDSDDPDGGVNAEGERCDGRDDDGDGQVDEGWPDVDGDGWADCVERDCDVSLTGAEKVPVDPLCLETPWAPPTNPWQVKVQWHVETGTTGVAVMPAVGNLTDDNGDGFVDDRDVPEIVVTEYGGGELIVLSGDTGRERLRIPGILGTAGVAVADVNADGRADIVAVTSGVAPRVVAYQANGDLLWLGDASGDTYAYATPVVGDLDGDGVPEVVVDRAVLDGNTGRTKVWLDVRAQQRSIRSAVLGDVDLDGRQEIHLGPDRFDPDGTREWALEGIPQSAHAALANLDADPEGEIIIVSGVTLEAYDPDGTLLYVVLLPGDNPGPPCVADFDGDGGVEVALGVGSAVEVFELDGTVIWSHPSVDSTAAHAGCSGYDFDGDGQYELLHADQHTFFIFNGATGDVLYQDTRHTSTTIFEYPVVADVDRDGAAEIVLVSNINDERAGWAGVTVFSHATDGWARSGPTWGVHDFAVTNLESDGTVPTDPPAPWLVHNVFRARPNVDNPALPNLSVEIDDICVGTCEGGPVKVAWSVTNHGGAPVPRGTRVTLFAMAGRQRVHLDTQLLPRIPGGMRMAGGMFELADPDVLGDGLLVVVDDDGSGRGWVAECDESDNFAPFEDDICP